MYAIERDEQSQDLICALEDPIDARIAKPTLVRIWLHVPASARDLDQLVRGAPEHLTREHLAARGLERPVIRVVRCREVRENAKHRVGSVDVGRSGGELALRNLEVRDRMAELHALFGERGHLDGDLFGTPGAAGGESEPSTVEYMDGDAEALADDTEHVIGWYLELSIRKLGLGRPANPQLADDTLDMKARHVRPNDERGWPLHPLATALDLGLCERSDDAGAMPIADPQLASVESPV